MNFTYETFMDEQYGDLYTRTSKTGDIGYSSESKAETIRALQEGKEKYRLKGEESFKGSVVKESAPYGKLEGEPLKKIIH